MSATDPDDNPPVAAAGVFPVGDGMEVGAPRHDLVLGSVPQEGEFVGVEGK